MTNVLTRLMALPSNAQRGVAIGLAILAGLLTLLVTFSAMHALADLRNAIYEGRYELARLDRLLAQKKYASKQADTTTTFLPGVNVAVVQAGVQTRVNTTASARGATVASVASLPMITLDGVQYVGVSVDLHGSLLAINNTLFDLETSSPPLIIREANIHSDDNQQIDGSPSSGNLSGEVVIFGAFKGDGLPLNLQGAKS